jgi:adenylyltransferase/sulfurtransferase
MPSYSELVEQARAEVDEISVGQAHEMLRESGEQVQLVDIRSREHMALGYIKGAALIPADELEMTVYHLLPDKSKPVLLYCESGHRSLFTALTLKEMGYTRVLAMAGGMTAWREAGYHIESNTLLTQDQLTRYSRQMLLPQVGADGQLKLLNAKVLLVGAGGLGSSAALYLAAAGVGTIGIADFDRVEKSNLNRQVIHATGNTGKPKTESAKEGLNRINPDIRVITYYARMTPENIADILKDFDILLDGSDNFQTKYLLNDAAFFAGKPYIFGGAVRTEGQAAVFFPGGGGPCLRCLMPQPPPQELAPT